jgi:archaemetzincin
MYIVAAMKLKTIILISILPVVTIATFVAVRETSNGTTERRTGRIILQPTKDVPTLLQNEIFEKLKESDSDIVLMPSISLPNTAYYAPRSRYRADSIIRWFSRHARKDETVLVVTTYDISTTKGEKADWGVIGLGFCPGNACVVSTFRLSKKNTADQVYKICLHELGHTRGLPHCTLSYCYMRDAEGHNVADDMTRFCERCRARYD